MKHAAISNSQKEMKVRRLLSALVVMMLVGCHVHGPVFQVVLPGDKEPSPTDILELTTDGETVEPTEREQDEDGYRLDLHTDLPAATRY